MSLIRLSARLEAIAKLVPAGIGAADVGTDHGYIPVWLAQNGYGGELFATDIKKDPLRHAEQTAAEYGLTDRISFHLCDGLAALDGKSVDTVVIAGMGGESIAAIISAAPWIRERDCLLILQPMSKSAFLRRQLYDSGFEVLSEQLIDDGEIYEILTAKAGKDLLYSPAELLIGHTRLILNNPLFEKRLDSLIEKSERAALGLASSHKEQDMERRADANETLLSLRELKEACRGN